MGGEFVHPEPSGRDRDDPAATGPRTVDVRRGVPHDDRVRGVDRAAEMLGSPLDADRWKTSSSGGFEAPDPEGEVIGVDSGSRDLQASGLRIIPGQQGGHELRMISNPANRFSRAIEADDRSFEPVRDVGRAAAQEFAADHRQRAVDVAFTRDWEAFVGEARHRQIGPLAVVARQFWPATDGDGVLFDR